MRTLKARTSREYDTKLLLEEKTENRPFDGTADVAWSAVTHFMGCVESSSGRSTTAGMQEVETTTYNIFVPWRDGTFDTAKVRRLTDTATSRIWYIDDVVDMRQHHREYKLICRQVN